MNDNGYQDGVYKVAEASELEAACLAGWRLVRELYEDRVTAVRADEPVPMFQFPGYAGNSYGSVFGGNASIERPMIVRVVRFLLKRDDTSVVAAAEARAAEALKLRDEAQAAAKAAEKAKLAAEEAVALMTDESDRFRARYKEAADRRDELKAQNQRMEADLGKVRAAIGDLRFREIVEAAG